MEIFERGGAVDEFSVSMSKLNGFRDGQEGNAPPFFYPGQEEMERAYLEAYERGQKSAIVRKIVDD